MSYDLDSSLVDATGEAVLLSQRDVAGQIPINFVTRPSVSLMAACFGHNVFEQHSATKCISNLLTVGYRRFLVDLYWSAERRKWTFCPVNIPANAEVLSLSSTTSTFSSDTVLLTTVETQTATLTSTATTTAPESTVTAELGSSGSLVYQLGPYACDDSLQLATLFDVLEDYFPTTASELKAYTTYLVFNLHAAASTSQPDEPTSALSGSQLPAGSETLGYMVNDALGSYLYSPDMLVSDRSNLNSSWFEVSDENKPIAQYFTINVDSKGVQSTPDGWPCEKYVQFAKERRILVGFGSVDPQLEGYDLTGDNGQIFPPGYLTSSVDISTDDGGNLESSCFYREDVTAVSGVNSSWAQSSRVPIPGNSSSTDALGKLSAFLQNLTSCGISPTLNSTLFDGTADDGIDPYKNVSFSSSWAWAIGEPRDASSSEDNENSRCAVMDVSQSGHWRAFNCSEERLVACRVGNAPFTWTLSTSKTPYWNASDACPENSEFAIPRTGLENMYLYQHLLSQSTDPTNREVWLDFNCLDVQSCWVSGGPDASCPYAADPHQLERRTVLVAAIAGIVILIITALTLFVKCNANRRNSRRRRRVIEGWEYEGVPS